MLAAPTPAASPLEGPRSPHTFPTASSQQPLTATSARSRPPLDPPRSDGVASSQSVVVDVNTLGVDSKKLAPDRHTNTHHNNKSDGSLLDESAAATTAPRSSVDDSFMSALQPRCSNCHIAFVRGKVVPYILPSYGHSLCGTCVELQTTDATPSPENAGIPSSNSWVCCAVKNCCGGDVGTSKIFVDRKKLVVNYALEIIDVGSLEPASMPATYADLEEHLGVACFICYESYDADRLPYALACGHSFCGPCIANLRVAERGLKCPNRCAASVVPLEQNPELVMVPINHGLLDLLNTMRSIHRLPLLEPKDAPLVPTISPPTRSAAALRRANLRAAQLGLENGDLDQTYRALYGLHSHRNIDDVAIFGDHGEVVGVHQEAPPLTDGQCRVNKAAVTYMVITAGLSLGIATAARPCERLREWLFILAIGLLLVPVVMVVIHRFLSLLLRRVLLGWWGCLFLAWLAVGAHRIGSVPTGAPSPDDNCVRTSFVWITSAVLVSIHFLVLVMYFIAWCIVFRS